MAESEDEKMTLGGRKLFDEHRGHSQHLCDLVAKRKMAEVARLTKGAKYVCHICGRGAAKSTNLCEPIEI
jgi:hypothetical protein